MKNLTKKEIDLILYALETEIINSSENSYNSAKKGNIKRAEEIEKYIKELKELREKIIRGL